MQTQWEGHFLNGVTAKQIPAVVKPTPHGIEIHSAEGTIVWEYNEINQTQGSYPGEPVRLEKEGDAAQALVIRKASTFMTALEEIAPQDFSRFRHPGRRARVRLWIALATLLSISIVAILYFWVIPAMAGTFADHVPLVWEERLGRTVVNALVEDSPVCDDITANQRIDEILDRLSEAAPQHPYTFRVTIVKDPMVNAFAAPGGYIVIYTGLLEKVHTPEELAGVLAHEMQHVVQRHGTKAIFQQLSTYFLVSILAADTDTAMEAVLQSAGVMGVLSYSRQHEEEADILAMQTLQKARIDPFGIVRFFKTLEEEFGDTPDFLKYLSSHPNLADRIQMMETMAEEADYSSVLLLTPWEWSQVGSACLDE